MAIPNSCTWLHWLPLRVEEMQMETAQQVSAGRQEAMPSSSTLAQSTRLRCKKYIKLLQIWWIYTPMLSMYLYYPIFLCDLILTTDFVLLFVLPHSMQVSLKIHGEQ